MAATFLHADPELGDGSLIHELDSQEERVIFRQMLLRAANPNPSPNTNEQQQQVGDEDEDEEGRNVQGRDLFVDAGEFWQLACLRARKYDIDRAIELTRNFMCWRKEYGIEKVTIDTDETYRALIERNVITASGNRDRDGRYVFAVRMRRTDPSQYTPRYVVRYIHAVLESLILRHPDAAIRGILIVMDLTGAARENLDPRVRIVCSCRGID